jgi:hypothetical protein
LDSVLERVPGAENCNLASDLITVLALHLSRSRSAQNPGPDLLSKSLEETLVCTVGTDPELPRSQFNIQLMRFLRKRGSPGLVRQFLSFHLFNVVWFQTSESFRSHAATPEAMANESFIRFQKKGVYLFIQEIENVERTCRNVVSLTWRSKKRNHPLDLSSAKELIANIEQRLFGAEA